MGVALIAWGRFLDSGNNKVTVPAPSTDGRHVPWLWDFLAAEAGALGRAGFSAIQLPPEGKAQGGAGTGCDGYGVYDPRDIGSKPQQGSTPTRYGSAESLRRAVARCHAAGMGVYLDLVMHQRIGANAGAGTYRYLGADGRTLDGRGALDPGCFRGVAPANRLDDAVPSPFWDISFGDELVYQNCLPAGTTMADALDALDWRMRTLGADGGRFDDVKGLWPQAVRQWASAAAMSGKFLYGEYFDGVDAIGTWAGGAPMDGRVSAEDFPLHFALQAFCAGGSALGLDGAGFAAVRPDLAVTFVENPDTDLTPGQNVVGSKLLAYAVLLSIEGYPFVYGKDYFGPDVWPGAYGLKPQIDNLIWVHEHLANGPTVTRHVDDRVIVFERTGWPGLLTAVSNDPMQAHDVTCATGFGPGVRLHDYTGRHPDIWVDAQGQATFTVPSNYFGGGQSYLCFSRSGLDAVFAPAVLRTTQTIFGAADLDVGPARDGEAVLARFEVAAGTRLDLALQLGVAGWSAASALAVFLRGPDGAEYCRIAARADGHDGAAHGEAGAGGWHELVLRASGMPAAGATFEATITYVPSQGALS